ncbi:MAG: carbohydrate-binding domain-containing protein, partial [Lachnospiraceae bacterium]|nr:carbohydrate-binding domain-containing protein [Lachnospiraceae bacterium]
MKRKMIMGLLTAGIIVMAGCGNTDTTTQSADQVVTETVESQVAEGNVVEATEGITRITEGGTYTFTGTVEQGQIIIDAPEENVSLVLNNFEITNTEDAPIVVVNAKNVYIELADGSENSITDAREAKEESEEETVDTETEDTEEDYTAAIYSKDDLVITGTSSLTVKAGYKDGITSKDDLELESGNITVEAVDDGIVGKDSVVVTEASVTVTAGDDGVKSTNDTDEEKGYIQIDGNSVTIDAQDKGIDATTTVTINGGKIDIKAGDEGIEGLDVVINDGDINIDAGDDGINISDGSGSSDMVGGREMTFAEGQMPQMGEAPAEGQMQGRGGRGQFRQNAESNGEGQMERPEMQENGSEKMRGMGGGMMDQAIEGTLTINGGNLTVYAEGDGLDSNGSILMNGGTVLVYGPTKSGNGAIDYNGTFEVNGGILMITSCGNMEQGISDTSKAIMVKQNFNTAIAAGSKIVVQNVSGEDAYEFVVQKDCTYIAVAATDISSDA